MYMNKILSTLTLSALLGVAAPVFAGDAGLGLGVSVDVNANAKKDAAAKKEAAETKAEDKKEEMKAKTEEKKDEAQPKADEHKAAAENHMKKGKKKLSAGLNATTDAVKSATDVNVKAGASAEAEKK